jgi:hypothetical protein
MAYKFPHKQMRNVLALVLVAAVSSAHAQNTELLAELQKKVNVMAGIAGPDHQSACSASMRANGFGGTGGSNHDIYEKCLAYLDEKDEEAKNLDSNVAAIQAGTKKPGNFAEAQKAYGALNGFKLAQEPKVRADGRTYSVVGTIYRADDQTPVFMGKVIGLNDSSNFVGVKVPKELEAFYFEKARLNKSFTVVGTYTKNLPYVATNGERGQMPVLEARYLELGSE